MEALYIPSTYIGQTFDIQGRVHQSELVQTLYNPTEGEMKKVDILAGALVIVGAVNWGLVAVAEFDLVATVFGLDFGETNAVTRVVYGLVGISGVWLLSRAGALRSRTSQPERVAV
jgi:uncharacterized membrane protein YuzA (DUF378 family)